MSHRVSSSDWVAVDRSADATALIGYLDAMHGQEAIRAYKQRSFALLELRPGDRVLDVGCGAGDDVRTLAQIVAPGGSAIGVDSSAAMVEEARRRSAGGDRHVEFRVGDANRLDFPDGAFDGARADRVLQHLDDPEQALAELIRVTSPGGRVVVAEPDWGTIFIDAPDRETTGAVLAELVARIRHPWIGRQLFGLFRRAGLADVALVPGPAVLADYAQADHILRLGEGISRARERGTVSEEAAAHWTRDLEQAATEGRFCCGLTGFIVAGRRP